eukprot:TRINITY_DN11875_c0_g1_i3.p1 TRINITY_DN11875_c0_g1~~TRINITY_DN11875_c0_g1_i3.p1  ORF type:complete len:138 (+),score=14.69 TRINITY_DN11875_c0_g1_i3:134-547(+)
MNVLHDSAEDIDRKDCISSLKQFLSRNPFFTDSTLDIATQSNLSLDPEFGCEKRNRKVKRLSRFIKLGHRNATVQTETSADEQALAQINNHTLDDEIDALFSDLNLEYDNDYPCKQSNTSFNYQTPKVFLKPKEVED